MKSIICRLIGIGIIFLCVGLLFSCLNLENTYESFNEESTANNSEQKELLEDEKYYQIVYSDNLYYYNIYDEENNIVKEGVPLPKKPDISMINDRLVCISCQAGIGNETRWSYYYDVEENIFSQTFYNVFDRCGDLIAYGNVDSVVVRDIFDDEGYSYSITSFEKPLADVVAPIVNAEFIDDGSSIKVKYLTGEDYKEVLEVKELMIQNH